MSPAALGAPLTEEHDFAAGEDGWFTYANTGTVSSSTETGELCVSAEGGVNPWDIAAQHDGVTYDRDATYTVAFDARATSAVTVPMQGGAGYPAAFGSSFTLDGSATPERVEFTFSPSAWPTDDPATEAAESPLAADWTTTTGNLSFQLGAQSQPYTLCVDNFAVSEAGENLIPNGDFATPTLEPWFAAGSLTTDLASSALVVGVPATSGQYDGVGFNGVPIEEGTSYEVSFRASASTDRTIRALVGQSDAPYGTVFDQAVALTTTPQDFSFTFTASASYPAVSAAGDPAGQLAFQVGGRGADWTMTLDDVSVVESSTPPPLYEPETGSRVRVNQVGYLPDGPKGATLVTEATEPLDWELRSGDTVVASGQTDPAGVDPTAGLNVHEIDFSDVTAPGSYTLVADGETSYEFVIDASIYQDLRQDALDYFYLARSGIEIDGSIVGDERYSRPAGHVDNPESTLVEDSPNRGDYDVPCLTAEEEGANFLYGDWTCNYTSDVVGGWYDAGDHGKYVVNGGISVAQVLGTYERTMTAPTGTADALGDGSLDIPLDEQANGVPDPLDEARWELEWMMSMQVPADATMYPGMVHHKIHDRDWTGLPLLPHLDPQERRLHRPSTAATLNFAAVAAQGARLWEAYDAEFAAELLAAGRVAYAAAVATPDLFQPAPNADPSPGGGPYNDDEVGDEFYWAAAELFLTTGEQEFEDAVLASEYNTADIWTPSGITWGDTAGLGRLNLATVESDIPGREAIRESVVAGAEKYLAWQAEQPFGTTYPGLDGRYEWGSNSMVLNNQVVLGTAFDLTGDQRFADAVLEAMDYLLGRNALNNSYITGYGDVFSQNQHSRWFTNQLDPNLPNPPVGSVSGGPNSSTGTWDPVIQGLYNPDYMCAPQRCYIDDIQSWSTNEITVNWNSVLSWVASFVADQGAGDRSDAGAVVRVVEHPSDATARTGGKVTFTASATGDPAPAVQWQRWVDGAWVDVKNATSTSLRVVANPANDGAQFRAFFRNEFGGAYTDAATLTVTAPAPKLTLVYVYKKVDPTRRASWGNSGPQTLVEVAAGHAWIKELDAADLPPQVCGPGWAVQTDFTVNLDEADVPTMIDRATWTNVLGWGKVVQAARHHNLEYYLGGSVPACAEAPTGAA